MQSKRCYMTWTLSTSLARARLWPVAIGRVERPSRVKSPPRRLGATFGQLEAAQVTRSLACELSALKSQSCAIQPHRISSKLQQASESSGLENGLLTTGRRQVKAPVRRLRWPFLAYLTLTFSILLKSAPDLRAAVTSCGLANCTTGRRNWSGAPSDVTVRPITHLVAANHKPCQVVMVLSVDGPDNTRDASPLAAVHELTRGALSAGHRNFRLESGTVSRTDGDPDPIPQ